METFNAMGKTKTGKVMLSQLREAQLKKDTLIGWTEQGTAQRAWKLERAVIEADPYLNAIATKIASQSRHSQLK
jgi:hypothetical protein